MPHDLTQPTRSSSKTILAVRMLVARTAWLDGRHYWRDGGVSWEVSGETFVPDAGDISRAQRHLNKVASFPNAARITVGDSQAWLRRKQGRLKLAKLLREMPKTEVTLLAQQARQRDISAAAALSRLLLAEALCLNSLPASPSAALAALGQPGVQPLLDVLLDDLTPPAARTLSALTLGAVSRAGERGEARQFLPMTAPLHARAFAWGSSHGLPKHPALAAELLAEGEDIARRGMQCAETNSSFGLPVQTLRELLAEGVPPRTVVELAEAAGEAGTVAERMLSVRSVLPDPQRQSERRQRSQVLRAERQQAVQALMDAVAAYGRSSSDPVLLRLTTRFFRQVLDLTDFLAPNAEAVAAVLDQALAVLQIGLKLPPAQQRNYWELLTEQQLSFGGPMSLLPGHKPHREAGKLRGWLHEARTKHLIPLCSLLASAQDKAAVAAIFRLGLQQVLVKQSWADPDLYRLFVTLAADLELKQNDYFAWELCWLLDAFPNAREARPYFQAFLQPLRGFPPALRRHVVEALLDEAGSTRQAVRQQLPRLIPLLPALARFAGADDGEWCACGPVFAAALALSQSVPKQAQERLNHLLSVVPASKGQERSYAENQSLRNGLTLAISLTAGDGEHFRDAVRAATQHHFRQNRERLEAGLRLLDQLPAQRRPLARLFAQQPQRVAELIIRLGLTTRLSTDVRPLLARLVPQATQSGSGTAFPLFLHPDRSWWRLHRQMPELTQTANAYLHAQWLRGQSQELPAGVRRALDRPQRIATELAYLENVLATAPDRAGIPARAAKLRGLLDDGPKLSEEICVEVGERLPQVAAEAQVAALELQVRACYQTRLEAVAGPLPPGMALTEDLINATLLTVDIVQNRKLLLHLLRAHLAGDRNWRERHPANKSFLETLKSRGIDRRVWLSELPHRYACGGVQGGRVHLRMERDPLHVLQMGNYFDTCLSFGGINAFSTVANACELNKRVIYARDASGHVVGRKLIGITAGGELIGFHTYCSLTEETGNRALRNVFQHYATQLADRCKLQMADSGTVPTLLAEDWYDDDAVAWAEDGTKSMPFKKAL